MHAIGEKGDPGDPGEKGDKGNELTDDDLKQKIKAFLVDPNVVTMDVKAAFK
ncbi:MAG: hypothetical protein ABS808_02955 [Wolbachia endosymbiont of Polyergus mexicanus]|uniref:Collagen-like protein n=1 Tax=Wolbachia endosymbiont of Polyergus mexicanus TaxID=3171167 RepID=A0AAU7YJF0_9RICK